MQVALVIEDDPATLIAWALVLRSFGFAVLEAASRGEVWRVRHQHQGPIHLVLMDAFLDHSTCEFVARLQLVYPQMRVLFVCNESPPELTDMPCEFAFLQKPFRVETLAYAVKQLLQGPKKRAAASLS